MQKPLISMIAAIGAQNRELGKDGDLLWHIPEDLKRFKELTSGHPVVMGRKTWESLPEKVRPLPNRTNIIVTRQSGYQAPGATVTDSLEAALVAVTSAEGSDEIFVIGGGELYAAALPHADRLYLTLINDIKDADAFFPPYESEFTKIISDESHESNGLNYRWVTLERP
jgi:dihydrofolate reductase